MPHGDPAESEEGGKVKALQLIRVGFDSMENHYSDAVTRRVLGTFIDVPEPDKWAVCKIKEFLRTIELERPYLGWDNRVYPQYEVKEIEVV